VWNQKLFFHVRHNEEKYHLKFTVYDRENFSGNDLVAWHQIPITDIITQSQQRQSKNASSSDNLTDMIDHDMDRYKLPLQMIKSERYKDKKPVLNIRAKFMPYNEIRKLFWRALLKAYDVDSTGSMNRLEVQSMLETIGSTITESTIDTFWRRYNKDPRNELEELTINQIVECLEEQMLAESTLGLQEPYSKNTGLSHSLGLEVFPADTFAQGFTEPGNVHQDGNTHDIHDESDCDDEDDEDDDEDEDEENDDNNIDNWTSMFDGFNLEMYDERRPSTSGFSSPLSILDRDKFDYSTPPITEEPLSILSNDNVDLAEALIEEENDMTTSLPFRSPALSRKYRRNSFAIEKVIRLTECPVCHRPNLSQRSQMDIVTHVATCVANDWTTVGRFLMGNFFTEAYAQRR
jgi:phosphatidylserine decarboxylase